MSERQELAQEILDAIGAKSGDPHDRLRTVLRILEFEGAVVESRASASKPAPPEPEIVPEDTEGLDA